MTQSSSSSEQFHDGAMALIDGGIRVRPAAGIRIGDGDATELRAPDDVRALGLRDVRIEQRVIFRRVAVRPPIHGDGGDIADGIETSLPQGASELIADVALEGIERGAKQ